MKSILLVFAFVFSSFAFAHEHDSAPVKMIPAFEELKKIAGTWEGQVDMGGKTVPVKAVYSVTSGGTAIVETLMPGTSHEMVTVYSTRGRYIGATHFCAGGNQPQFKLKKSGEGSFVFEMDGSQGLNDKNEGHMHGVTLTLNGDKLKAEWTNYEKNKKIGTKVFEFTRKG